MGKSMSELRRADDLTLSHRSAAEVPFPDQVQALKRMMGPKLLALAIGVDDSTIDRWIGAKSQPNLQNEAKVRACYQVYELLKPVDESPTIRAWFMGMNPQLDDRSPAEAVAEGDLREVLMAARAFRAGG
jgi:hypothetical protein